MNLATVMEEWGDLERAGALLEDPGLRDSGSDSDRRWVLVERAVLAYHPGDWEEVGWLIDAFEEAAGTVPHYMEFGVLDLRARLSLARGALEDALEATAREVELARASSPTLKRCSSHSELGRNASERPDGWRGRTDHRRGLRGVAGVRRADRDDGGSGRRVDMHTARTRVRDVGPPRRSGMASASFEAAESILRRSPPRRPMSAG